MTFQTFFLSFRLEDKIKNICLIIFLSLILFSCGEKEEAEEESNITELEGTWKTECYYKAGYGHHLSGIRYNTDNYSYIDTLTYLYIYIYTYIYIYILTYILTYILITYLLTYLLT